MFAFKRERWKSRQKKYVYVKKLKLKLKRRDFIYFFFFPFWLPGTCKFIELASRGEDDQSDFRVAENRKLKGLLQKPISPLRECHLATCGILNTPHLRFSSHHFVFSPPSPLLYFFFQQKKRKKKNERFFYSKTTKKVRAKREGKSSYPER